MGVKSGKLETSHKVLFFIAGLLLVSTLLFFFFIQPQLTRMDELKAKVDTEKAKVQAIQTFVLTNPVPDTYLKEVDNRLAAVNRSFPDQIDISSFIVAVAEQARASKVQLINIHPGTPTINPAGYQTIPVDVSVRGGYDQLLGFIGKIEEGPRFTSVGNVTMRSIGSEVQVQISFLVYSYGIPKDKAPAPAAK